MKKYHYIFYTFTFSLVFCFAVTKVAANVDTRTTPQTTQPAVNCQQKARELSLVNLTGHYYYFSDGTQQLNWTDADNFCKSRGLELVSIQHTAKNTRIITHILGIRSDRYLNGMWTSGTRSSSNTWSWSATGKPVEYSAWFDRHPLSDTSKDKIAIAGFRTKVRWISLGGNEERRFICELLQPCSL